MKHVTVAAAILAVLGVVLALLANAGMWVQLQRVEALQHETSARAQAQQASLVQENSALHETLEALREQLNRARAEQEKLRAQVAALPQAQAPAVDLPAGVRVFPRTNFIPQDAFAPNNFNPLKGRAWGPEQATGAPDTPAAGDQQTAWASLTQDGQDEWLQLEYDQAVTITKVKVYETFNPGALSHISVVDDDGKEAEVWRGQDPTTVGTPMGVSEITLPTPTKGKRVKLYLDSMRVAGWNEIDAVGIVDDQNAVHWAVRATASSTYAEQGVALPEPVKPVNPPRPPQNDAF